MKYAVRFFTLTGKFSTLATEVFESLKDAKVACENHAKTENYTNVRYHDDDDWTIRVTANPPVGRAGRNIASIEPDSSNW